jgi:multidrug efflux pump subunit AcrB
VAALCLLGGILLLSLFALMNGEGGDYRLSPSDYSVTFRHYGVDAREIERTIAIPLEDALSAIAGVNRVVTLSENSRLRAYAGFHRNGNAAGYEAVREAAQRVYETLPASAQRPELGSQDDSRIPVWTAAVWETSPQAGRSLERSVKPALERLPGVAEVEISGSGINEIVVAPDPEKSAALSLSPRYIASVLARNDGLFSGGVFRDGERELLLNVDSRYQDLHALSSALIPFDSESSESSENSGNSGGVVRLGDIAAVYERERESESIARLDGRKTAVISLTAASGADLGKLSRLIKGELDRLSSLPLEFHILMDRGEEEAAAFRSVLSASLQAAVIVAVSAALLMGRKNKSLMPAIICALSVPLVSFVSASLLSVLGFSPDRKLLAGLSVGIGAAADAVILSAEGFGAVNNPAEGGRTLRRLLPPMISAAFTTVAALLPLASFSLSGDIASIAWALGAVTLVSMFFALTVLPPLFIVRVKPGDLRSPVPSPPVVRGRSFRRFLRRFSQIIFCLRKTIIRARRRGLRIFILHIRFCLRRPWCPPLLSLLISAAGCFALFLAGADIGSGGSENSVYARLEFEGGFRKEEGDRLLSTWAGDIKKHNGILSVQTSARIGSGAVLVTFDPGLLQEKDARTIIRSRSIPGAFVYISENSADERSWEITFSGADDKECRNLAEKAAALCASFPLVRETVLNFKEGNPRLTFIPRRDLFSQGGIFFSAAADTIRRGVYGPVAYKRITPDGEVDVRVRLSSSPLSGDTEAGKILSLPLASGDPLNESFRVGSLTETFRDREPSLIRREDRRRTASISVRTAPMDPRKAKEKILEFLRPLEFPAGYTIEFDREAIRTAETLSKTSFRFLFALLFCYMIIAAASESFVLPLIILSPVPPSLAVPVLILTFLGFPVNAAVACSLVALSGMAVNAAVLTGENFKQFLKNRKPLQAMTVYRLLRARLPVLAACTGTTAAGALPFLLLRENSNVMLRVLSLVTFFGVTASAFCSLALIPSWVQLCVRLRAKPKKNSACAGG